MLSAQAQRGVEAGLLAGQPFRPGQVWLVPAGAEPFALDPRAPARLLRTFVPE